MNKVLDFYTHTIFPMIIICRSLCFYIQSVIFKNNPNFIVWFPQIPRPFYGSLHNTYLNENTPFKSELTAVVLFTFDLTFYVFFNRSVITIFRFSNCLKKMIIHYNKKDCD